MKYLRVKQREKKKKNNVVIKGFNNTHNVKEDIKNYLKKNYRPMLELIKYILAAKVQKIKLW